MSEKEKQSEHYHSIEKGCEIEEKIFPVKRKSGLKGGFCKTHQKDICRCGWEWHWHYEIYTLGSEKHETKN